MDTNLPTSFNVLQPGRSLENYFSTLLETRATLVSLSGFSCVLAFTRENKEFILKSCIGYYTIIQYLGLTSSYYYGLKFYRHLSAEALSSALASFQREIDIYTIVGGEVSPKLIMTERTAQYPYFISERPFDTTLRNFIDANHDFATCIRVLKGIALHVAYIHTHGVVHTDLTPDNILVDCTDGDVVVYVIDFNTSVYIGQHLSSRQVFHYYSPNLLQDSVAAFDIDVFAWLVIAHETLLRTVPVYFYSSVPVLQSFIGLDSIEERRSVCARIMQILKFDPSSDIEFAMQSVFFTDS